MKETHLCKGPIWTHDSQARVSSTNYSKSASTGWKSSHLMTGQPSTYAPLTCLPSEGRGGVGGYVRGVGKVHKPPLADDPPLEAVICSTSWVWMNHTCGRNPMSHTLRCKSPPPPSTNWLNNIYPQNLENTQPSNMNLGAFFLGKIHIELIQFRGKKQHTRKKAPR